MKNDYLLDNIANNIGKYCTRWGRISVNQTKEKYNTVRVYCGFGYTSLHTLVFPNYVHRHKNFPKWLWYLDIYYISKFLNLFQFIIVPYQKWIYRKAYWKYIKKYPHLFEEITCCSDYKELLGFYTIKLCSGCSEDYKKDCYLVDPVECEECNEDRKI